MRPSLEALLREEGIADAVRLRPLDLTIPFELNFVVEASTKTRCPRDVPYRHWQQTHEPLVRRYVAECPVVVAELVGPQITTETSVVLGFAVATHRQVRMLYVKRNFRGYGLGMRLLEHAGAAEGGAVRATAWEPNRCWALWLQTTIGNLAKAKRAEVHAHSEAP